MKRENPDQTIPFPFCSICGAQMPDNKKSTLVLHKKVEHAKELAKAKRKKRIAILLSVSLIGFYVGVMALAMVGNSPNVPPEDMKCYALGSAIDNKIYSNNFSNLDIELEKMSESCSNIHVSFGHGIKTATTGHVIAP